MEKCARASLFFWVFWVAWQGMGYGSGSAASGVLRLCGYSAGSLPTREAAPGMRTKSFAVMVSRYCVWPSFFPDWTPSCRHLAARKECRSTAFLALDTVGSFLWSGVYVGLGYLFSNELDVAIRWVQHFGTALGIAIGVPIVLYAGWRGLTLARMIRQLRLRRISPPMLARKLKSNSKVAVLDLLNFEEETDSQSVEAHSRCFQCGSLSVAEVSTHHCSG